MNCPSCNRETEPSLFCHFCDVYMSNVTVGTKAGVSRRFAAQLLDGLVIWAILFLFLALAALVAGASESAGLTLTTLFWAVVAYIVFAMWFLSQGKTPGKWMLGIRVVDKTAGSVPGLGRMLVREIIGKCVSGFFFGIGYFWAIVDREGQAWHDKIANTVVTRQPARLAAQCRGTAQAFATAATAGSFVPPPRAIQVCRGCGASLEDATEVCTSCGVRL